MRRGESGREDRGTRLPLAVHGIEMRGTGKEKPCSCLKTVSLH